MPSSYHFRLIALLFFVVLGPVACNRSSNKEAGDPECAYKKTGLRPADTYPFSAAGRISIVSYDTRADSYENDTLIVNGAFRVKNIREKTDLDSAQKDSLFSILFSYAEKRSGGEQSMADCYNPRHSVVFYKGRKAIAFLEVCLECGRTRQSPGTDFGSFCNGKMCMLQKFFQSLGIKEGITDEICP